MRQSYLKKKALSEFNEHPKRIRSWARLSAQKVCRKLRIQYIALDRILCGGEHGLTGLQFSSHYSREMTRPSTPVRESPHARLLEEYKKIGELIFQPEIFLQSEYYRNAVNSFYLFGHYFSATLENQVIFLAKNFVKKYEDEPIDTQCFIRQVHFSDPSQPVRVLPIKYSDCFQVWDGHHRLAIASARNESKVAARVINWPQLTPLQELLLEVNRSPGKLEIYQPIESPELKKHWRLVRRCTDRFEMMQQFLQSRGLDALKNQTYLDVACGYGWFVRAMEKLGYRSRGVEIDWAARQIGKYFYRLHENQLIGSEVVRFFRSEPSQYDIISCFGLMHHFVMGRGSISPQALLGFLDRATKGVLFFGMGEEHEACFSKSLAGWNPDTIENWLRVNGNFREIVRLGTDKDRVSPYEKNYGRTLFACIK